MNNNFVKVKVTNKHYQHVEFEGYASKYDDLETGERYVYESDDTRASDTIGKFNTHYWTIQETKLSVLEQLQALPVGTVFSWLRNDPADRGHPGPRVYVKVTDTLVRQTNEDRVGFQLPLKADASWPQNWPDYSTFKVLYNPEESNG